MLPSCGAISRAAPSPSSSRTSSARRPMRGRCKPRPRRCRRAGTRLPRLIARAWPRPRRISAIGSCFSNTRASSGVSQPRPTPTSRSPRSSIASSSRRAGAAVRETEGVDAPAPDQPVRHRAPHVPRARRRQAGRRRREARRRARHATAPRGRRKGQGPAQAEVGRGFAPEDGLQGRLPGDRPPGRRRRPRPAADPALLARRSRAVHHAPRRDHEGPEDRCPQRRHVPHAGRRQELDLHALADAQGRASGPARLRGREDPGCGRGRARPGVRVRGERPAPAPPGRADARRLLARRPGRARALQDDRPRGARERGDRARRTRLEGRRRGRGPFRRPHGLLLARGAVSVSSTSRR